MLTSRTLRVARDCGAQSLRQGRLRPRSAQGPRRAACEPRRASGGAERTAPAAGRSGLRGAAGQTQKRRTPCEPACPSGPPALVLSTPPFPSSGRARGCTEALLRERTGIPPSTERSGLFTVLTSAAGGNPRLQLLLTSPRRDSASPPRPPPRPRPSPAPGPASGSSSKPRPRSSPAPSSPPGADVEGGASLTWGVSCYLGQKVLWWRPSSSGSAQWVRLHRGFRTLSSSSFPLAPPPSSYFSTSPLRPPSLATFHDLARLGPEHCGSGRRHFGTETGCGGGKSGKRGLFKVPKTSSRDRAQRHPQARGTSGGAEGG